MMFEQLNVSKRLLENHLYIDSIAVNFIAIEYRIIGEKVNMILIHFNMKKEKFKIEISIENKKIIYVCLE